MPGRDLDRGHGQRPDPVRGAVRRANVRRYRRVPPLLQPPLVQDQPRGAVRTGVAGAELGAARRALVGGGASPSPPPLRHRAGRALAAAARVPVRARRLDLRPAPPRDGDGRGAGPGAASRAGVAGALAAGPRGGAGHRLLRARRMGGTRRRLLLEHGAAVPRDLLHQLAGARDGEAALRHRRRQPQQLVAGADHAGRGVAQQPPRLPAQHAPGLPLVRDRPDVLRAEGAVVGGPGLGAGRAAGRGRAQRAAPGRGGGGEGGAPAGRRLPGGPDRRGGACRAGPRAAPGRRARRAPRRTVTRRGRARERPPPRAADAGRGADVRRAHSGPHPEHRPDCRARPPDRGGGRARGWLRGAELLDQARAGASANGVPVR